MAKVFSRKAMTTVLVSSLLLSAGGAAVSAAPKEDKKDTGRTEQKVQTGVISYKDITVPRGAEEVILSGTVEIDGPQLVVKIPGSKNMKISKVGDKVWMYEAVVDILESYKGDTYFEISAHTIYSNGKNAGDIHTSTPTVTQKIHVPYVTSTVAENTKWTAYNRSSNEFTLSYNEVENWSEGDAVVTPKWLTVEGTDDEVTVLGTTVEVPTAIKNFKFADKPDWAFDDSTKTYSATFDVFITDSKGVVTKKPVTETGLAPGQVHTIFHTVSDDFGTITESVSYTSPAAPVVEVVVDRLENVKFTLVYQNQNRLKVEASYDIVYSNKAIKTINKVEFDGTLGNPNGNQKDEITKDYIIEGFVYTVTAHYNATTKTYYATWELKK